MNSYKNPIGDTSSTQLSFPSTSSSPSKQGFMKSAHTLKLTSTLGVAESDNSHDRRSTFNSEETENDEEQPLSRSQSRQSVKFTQLSNGAKEALDRMKERTKIARTKEASDTPDRACSQDEEPDAYVENPPVAESSRKLKGKSKERGVRRKINTDDRSRLQVEEDIAVSCRAVSGYANIAECLGCFSCCHSKA